MSSEGLDEVLALARGDWPEVALPEAVFVAALQRHGAARDNFFDAVCAGDLYLATACAEGVPSALAAFDASFLSQVPAFVGQFDTQKAFSDEVAQLLRLRLLVGEKPKIGEYGGLGPLLAFLRVAAVRVALNLRRGAGQAKTQSAEDAALEALPVSDDPELKLVRARYAVQFKEAMRDSFRALPAEQREALRLHFAGKFPSHRIATMMGVHRGTVTRWLSAARLGVLHGTRRTLSEKLRLSATEVDGLIAVLRSQLDASMGELVSSAQG